MNLSGCMRIQHTMNWDHPRKQHSNDIVNRSIQHFCYTLCMSLKWQVWRLHTLASSFMFFLEKWKWYFEFGESCGATDPTSIVIRLHLNPALLMDSTSSAYLTFFLKAASSKRVSKGMVNSNRVTSLLPSSHDTISGHSQYRLYEMEVVTIMQISCQKHSLAMFFMIVSTSTTPSCPSSYRLASSANLHEFMNKVLALIMA